MRRVDTPSMLVQLEDMIYVLEQWAREDLPYREMVELRRAAKNLKEAKSSIRKVMAR